MERALTEFSREELIELMSGLGEPSFRADQILDWIWKKKVGSIEDMVNLPLGLRVKLSENFRLAALAHARTEGSSDTTRKYLFRLRDGRYVESVLIPANPALYGERADRHTVCVSSQVGCAMGCKFCASGLAGFTRNLSGGEIAEQVWQAERLGGVRADNVVVMGMGEPFHNYDHLIAGLETLTADWGLHLGARHITVSTSGIVPGILKFADYPQQIRLAVSLHGATDEVRGRIMPINKKWPVGELFIALEHWNAHKKQFLTFEYILIKGVNDDLEQARLLARHAKRLRAKVNLIPYNTVQGLEWERPEEGQCRAFARVLEQAGVRTMLRVEKGGDIDAACGQLRLKQESEEGIIAAPMKRR